MFFIAEVSAFPLLIDFDRLERRYLALSANNQFGCKTSPYVQATLRTSNVLFYVHFAIEFGLMICSADMTT